MLKDTGATQPNVSNPLRVLRRAGVVVPEPRGRYTYYRLRPEVFEAAASHLSLLAAKARETVDRRREC